MLKTKVILSHVTNLSDARYASGMGVNYIGFSINPENSQFVTAEEAKSISGWLSGVSIIGEIGSTLPADLKDYAATYVQTSNVLLVDTLTEPILALDVNPVNISEVIGSLNKYSDRVGLFVLNVEAEQLPDLQPQLSEFCSKYPVYISTEFDDKKLAYVLDEINPTGIVLYGSDEEKPGLSSYDGIADILELLEED
jgi:phosphoribosylanthranilate isomerase